MIFEYLGENKIKVTFEEGEKITNEDLNFIVNGEEDDVNFMKKMDMFKPIETGAENVLKKVLGFDFNSYSLDLEIENDSSLILTFNNTAYVSDDFFEKSKQYGKKFSSAGLIPRTPSEMIQELGWELLGSNKNADLSKKILIVKDNEGVKQELGIFDIMEAYYNRFSNK